MTQSISFIIKEVKYIFSFVKLLNKLLWNRSPDTERGGNVRSQVFVREIKKYIV